MNSQDFHNWCKLEFLMTRTSEFLRNHFKRLWQTRFSNSWENSSGQDLVKIIKPNSFKSYFKSQQSLLQSGKIDDWDLALLKNVYKDSDICRTGKKGDNFKRNVEKLAEIRNKLAHIASKNIPGADFEANWEKMVKILVKMGESKDELDELKAFLRSNKMILLRSQNITKANEMKLEGNKYFKENNYTEAISSYTNAIGLKDIPDQDLAILYSNRSASYLKRYSENGNNDDIKNALKDAKECKKLRPEWSKAYFRLGKAYLELNKLDKAVKEFDKALYLEPNDVELKNVRADARKAKGKQDRYEHLDPGIHGVTDEQAFQEFYMRTGIHQSQKDLDDLRKLAEKSDPVLKIVWKGHYYREGRNGFKKDLTKAAQYYQRAAEKGNVEAMYNLACLIEQGQGVKQDYELAFSLFRAAAGHLPFDPHTNELIVGVGEAQVALGVHYWEGIYVDKDELTAVYWFERGVEIGYGRSANNLGLMYLIGQGVTQDLKRAEQYLLFAFSHKDPNAPINLANLYTHLEDPEKAIKWNKIAIEKGSLVARGKQKDFEAIYSEWQNRLKETDVEEWEKAENLSPENLTPLERIHRRLKSDCAITFNLFENFRRNLTELMVPPKAQEVSSKIFNFPIKELEKYSQKSETARRMYEATSHFRLSVNLLIAVTEYVSFDNELCHKFIFHLAESYRLEHIVGGLPLDMIESAKRIAKMIFSHIHSLSQVHELDETLLNLDQEARLCYAVLNLGSPDIVIEFLSESLKNYPKNKDFLLFRGYAYSFQKQFEDALRNANRGLEIEPDNYEFLKTKAVSLRLLGHADAVKAYEEFISKAPINHRKIPEAYYAMGTCTLNSEEGRKHLKSDSDSFMKVVKEYYEKGLEMEKKQLPFFLPYESTSKKELKLWMDWEKSLEEIKSPSSIRKVKLKDPSRKELILLNRRNFEAWDNLPEGDFGYPFTFKPPKEQKLPKSLIGLKQTYLNEIDFTKDHILAGYILEVTVIDVANRNGKPIKFIVEDKNEHVQRVALYNFDERFEDVKELGFGSKFSIINPYIRMALMDDKPLIRVDDPLTVIFSEKCRNFCACCGDSPATFTCSKCLAVNYCSAECQIEDWIKFKHKLICVKKSEK